MERTALQETEILPQGDRLPANHPPAFDGPISGPGVWRGSDLQNTDEWKYVLSSAEKKDLLKATAKAAAEFENIQDIKKSDFELPILGEIIKKLKREIIHGRGFVLLRGLPLEKLSFADIATMYWGIGTHIGSARSQNTRGHLLGHVIDLGSSFENKSERGYLTNRHLKYHCDSVDIVGLLCLRHAKQGGASSIVSSYTIHNEMWKQRPDLARTLYGPVARDRRDEIPPGKGPWYELPVFNHFKGRLAINFLRTHIDMSQRHPDALRMSDQMVEALDLLYDLANDPAFQLTMEFEPGDMQLLHNHQILHDRTAYKDWDDQNRKRYLLRLWLSPPDGIELPMAFAGRYNSVVLGDRGGVTIPGMQTSVPLKPI
tara:strand:- start:222 stop:1337 length:1116 start_codon:yes stop_codon:yes gene_type:complete